MNDEVSLDYRDPNKNYLKKEDILEARIPRFAIIEIGIRPNAMDDKRRGRKLETRVGYFAGVGKWINYDTLNYVTKLTDGKPEESTYARVMLPTVDWVRVAGRKKVSVKIKGCKKK
ncbi:MAG: hypothetical protein AABX11_04160 [Nanoarchaeota archaeon]